MADNAATVVFRGRSLARWSNRIGRRGNVEITRVISTISGERLPATNNNTARWLRFIIVIGTFGR